MDGGRNPKLKIIQSTNTTELSEFGRKAKALMDSPEYKEVFQTRLKKILKLQVNGKHNKVVNTMLLVADLQLQVVADLLIIDDPHTEQDAMNAQADRTYEWYQVHVNVYNLVVRL